jgi:N6-adenosine-specific RNA methylase IME4
MSSGAVRKRRPVVDRESTALALPEVASPDTPVRLLPTGLEIRREIGLEEWESVLRTLCRLDGAVQWAIGDCLAYGAKRPWGERYEAAMAATGYEYATLREYRYVSSRFDLLVRTNKLSFFHYRLVAPLREEAAWWLARAEEGEVDADGVRRRWSVKQLLAALSKWRRQRAREQAGPMPTGPFGVIYADPPWAYDFAQSDARAIEEDHFAAIDCEDKYPAMDLEDICALPVPAEEHAVLFLWATSPKLPDAMTVLDAWAFTYRTCMVWVKDQIGMGYYARQQHELLLIAVKGHPPLPEEADRPASVISAPRGRHSEKPMLVYETIERMYPHFAKLELFARQPRPGWTVWGTVV